MRPGTPPNSSKARTWPRFPVSHQPGVDGGVIGAENRRIALGALPRRWHGRLERLTHVAPVRLEAPSQLVDRQLLALVRLSDLFVELHPRPFRHAQHGPRWRKRERGPWARRPQVGPNQTVKTVPGGAKSECHSHVSQAPQRRTSLGRPTWVARALRCRSVKQALLPGSLMAKWPKSNGRNAAYSPRSK